MLINFEGGQKFFKLIVFLSIWPLWFQDSEWMIYQEHANRNVNFDLGNIQD